MKKRVRMLLFLVACCMVLSSPLPAEAADSILSSEGCVYESNCESRFHTYCGSCEEHKNAEENSFCGNQEKKSSQNTQLLSLLFKGTSLSEALSEAPSAYSCKAESGLSANNGESAVSQSGSKAPTSSSCAKSSFLDYGSLLRSYFAMLREQCNAYTPGFQPNTETITEVTANTGSKPIEKPAASTGTISNFAQEVVELVNEERAAEGLAPLTIDPDLSAAAEIRAKEILGTFSHTRPNGSSCFTALDQVGASYRRAGENIALGQSTARQVVEDWMDSPGHRENIMNSSYSRIGVATEKATRGYGWAQFFAD